MTLTYGRAETSFTTIARDLFSMSDVPVETRLERDKGIVLELESMRHEKSYFDSEVGSEQRTI